jgi:WD40 repeat protein
VVVSATVVVAATVVAGGGVVTGGADKTVKLWDLATGKEVRQMTGHTAEAVSGAFGPEA